MQTTDITTGSTYTFSMNVLNNQASQKSNQTPSYSGDAIAGKLKSGELNSKDVVMAYQMSYMIQIGVADASSTSNQSPMLNQNQNSPSRDKVLEILNGLDLSATGYSGPDLTKITQEQAQKLVSDNGFFGVKQTSNRMADFVINGAGNNLDTLKQGRDGIIQGYKAAEAKWGGQLPDISKKTLEAALAKVDKRIEELGGSAVDLQA